MLRFTSERLGNILTKIPFAIFALFFGELIALFSLTALSMIYLKLAGIESDIGVGGLAIVYYIVFGSLAFMPLLAIGIYRLLVKENKKSKTIPLRKR